MVTILAFLFYGLLFFTPLVMNIHTSEIFEFNKSILLYTSTILIITVWLVRMIVEKKIIFKKTFLDMPLLLFVGTQGISTILSIDFRTSLLGYYSRFNGGFVSIICYALLYWAWVSNMDAKRTRAACYVLLVTSLPVCLYGILQHFGIDKDIWVQDVQNRIFSTLGQPNWLAAWICGIAPLTWTGMVCHSRVGGNLINNKTSVKHEGFSSNWIPASGMTTILYLSLAILLFTTLLFTKSRSGLLAFGIEFVIFWCFIFFPKWKLEIGNWKLFSFLCLLFTVFCLFLGTPWTPSIFKTNSPPTSNTQPLTTSLETGGTESGDIRKIVWQGALDIWKNYPIFGTGVETFAFAYYQFKPEAHNYTSEWDYLYNKAHNEYLNYLATTGAVGLITYFVFILVATYQISNFQFLISKQVPISKIQNSRNVDMAHSLVQLEQLEIRSINIALISGFISILVTNFFGFSVVPVSLLFFLFPAMAKTVTSDKQQVTSMGATNLNQKIGISLVLLVTCYLLLSLSRYYSADLAYASGRQANREKDVITAQKKLLEATDKSPNEAIFWDELSLSNKQIATALGESKQLDKGKKYALDAIENSKTAIELSPRNINLKRNYASTLTALSSYDQNYLTEALNVLKESIVYAPTDPKLQYALAASYYRLGQLTQAITEMKKVTEMKTDYKDGHYALALMYIDAKDKDKAKEELEYILEKIDGNDQEVKKELEELK